MQAVAIVGAGPGGLATAAALEATGVEALLLDRADSIGASWRAHYDRLHLHTARRFSALPGMAIPREYGQWVSRDDVVRYLEAYAAHHALPVRLGVSVENVARQETGWRLATSDGPVDAERVVVATGYNHTPLLPEWPGREAFRGELRHASAYKNPAPYRGRDVLVVGAGPAFTGAPPTRTRPDCTSSATATRSAATSASWPSTRARSPAPWPGRRAAAPAGLRARDREPGGSRSGRPRHRCA